MVAKKAAPKKAAAKPAVETVSKETQDGIYLDPVLAAARDEQIQREAQNPLPPRTTEATLDPVLAKQRDAEIKAQSK